MTFDHEDESFERELFAMRARALPVPALDLTDVLERAARSPVRCPERDRRLARGARAAWVGAAACAAASYFGVVPLGETSRDDGDRTMSSMSIASESDGLACRADRTDLSASFAANETLSSIAHDDARTSCVAQEPSALVCAQDVTFSIARP